ncbi:MAG: glycosyltransferase family 4 protein [Chloroflexi bacterium]|nr:glycosyltransferase family 4 protein [Chloroflexota bacterium]
MKVCLVSIHPRLLSGQINALVGLARGLRDRGHEVQLVTAFAETRLLDPERIYGPEANAGLLLSKLARVVRIVRRLQNTALDADVVQMNLPTPSFALVGDIVQALLGRPIVVGFEAHLPAVRDLVSRRLVAAPQFYLPQLLINNRLIARTARFRAARYVVASALQAAELEGLGVPRDRISVIPNLVDLSRLDEDLDPDAVALPQHGPIISYIGHFNHVKGVDVLVRAMPFVLERHPTAHLVIAWSGLGPRGPIWKAIRETGVGERVHLIGRVPVAGLLRRSTVFALPYRLTIGQAAYPGLVLEAMATGVPLVTSDLPLLREIIEPGREAELAHPEDPEDLARAICRLLDDPAHRAQMVRAQRFLMRFSFDPARLVRQYEEIYDYGVVARSGCS